MFPAPVLWEVQSINWGEPLNLSNLIQADGCHTGGHQPGPHPHLVLSPPRGQCHITKLPRSTPHLDTCFHFHLRTVTMANILQIPKAGSFLSRACPFLHRPPLVFSTYSHSSKLEGKHQTSQTDSVHVHGASVLKLAKAWLMGGWSGLNSSDFLSDPAPVSKEPAGSSLLYT